MKKNISPLKVVHPNHFTLTLKVDISWNAKKGYIIRLSYMQWKRRQTPSDTVSTQDVMTKHKSGFINFKDQKSEPMYREEIHFFFQNIPNKPIISISFFFFSHQQLRAQTYQVTWNDLTSPALRIMWQQATNIQILSGSNYSIMYSCKEAIT